MLIFSEQEDSAYGLVSSYKDRDDFVRAVIDSFEGSYVDITDVMIKSCIVTESTIPAESIISLEEAGVKIGNYYTAKVNIHD